MHLADVTSSTLFWAITGGGIPTLAWVWYFTRQTVHHESTRMMFFAFTSGAISVWVAMFIQKYIISTNIAPTDINQIFLFAVVEEACKFFLLRILVMRLYDLRYRSDYVHYMIVSALGFAAMENILYLINPLIIGDTTGAVALGHLRFFGSTVVHAVSSGLHGLWVGLALGYDMTTRSIAWLMGLVSATILHGLFNYYISQGNTTYSAIALFVLWVLLMIVTSLFHKSEMRIAGDIVVY